MNSRDYHDGREKNFRDEYNSSRDFNKGEATQNFSSVYLMTPKRRMKGCWLWTIVAALIIIVTTGVGGIVLINHVLPFQCTTNFPNPVKLTMYYDTEMYDWINNVVGDFNKQCKGRVKVELHGIISGQSVQNILDGRIQPDIWSPASSVWLGLLNEQWQKNHHGSNIISTQSTDTPSLVKSPVVIAMWKPMAEAMGWPNKPIWWGDIAALSTNSQGWAAYEHPEWGNFKFGHTDPNYSNSGLASIIAENYAATHKVSGLTLDDVNRKTTQDFVASIESSIIHYGDSIDAFADEMFNKGPSYLSAAVMNENLVAEANSGKKYTHLAHPVVAIYPKEGTFISDHPLAILQTSWLTPTKKNAALLFRNFLLDSPQQQKTLTYYFRPGTFIPPNGSSSPLDSVHGVDITQPTVPLHFMPPDPRTTNGITTNWSQERNKVDVMLILDHSGSMDDLIDGKSKLDKAKQGLIDFVSLMSNSDGLGLTIFSDQEEVLTPISPLGPKRQNISALINKITTSGNTQLYDTIADQVVNFQALAPKNIKAIVVLTDGKNDEGHLSLDDLIKKISPSGNNEGEGIKVYTIAYGNPADIDSGALKKIATTTGGQEYSGTPQSILQVYEQITQKIY